MRKLIVSMNVTLDGFMAGPDCELDWHFQHWCGEMGDALAAELYKADCLLFGRITYCGMMRHWQNIAVRDTSLSRADMGFFSRVADCRKVVCSNTLRSAPWENSTLLNGDLKKKLVKLKQSAGKNIVVYGSGQLVGLLMQLNLVDELQLWLHPVLLGKGKPLCKDQRYFQSLKLLKTKRFSTGVVLLCYRCIIRT
jgi:dihydrofolate reductase